MMESFVFVTYRLIIVNKHHKANLYSCSNRLCEWHHGPPKSFSTLLFTPDDSQTLEQGMMGACWEAHGLRATPCTSPLLPSSPPTSKLVSKQARPAWLPWQERSKAGPWPYPLKQHYQKEKNIIAWLLYSKTEKSNSTGLLCSSFSNRRPHHLSHCVTACWSLSGTVLCWKLCLMCSSGHMATFV